MIQIKYNAFTTEKVQAIKVISIKGEHGFQYIPKLAKKVYGYTYTTNCIYISNKYGRLIY